MLGSIIGDIAGSYYEVLEVLEHKNKKIRSYEERIKILDKNVPLFSDNSSYTDDSVLTTAVSDALLHDKNYEYYLRKYGNDEVNLGLDKYGRSRFSKGFIEWLSDTLQGSSYGNGSAMRVGPIGYYYDKIEDVIENARLVTIPSHNTKEAIKGATAVATTIYLARTNHSKEYIKKYVETNFNYDLSFDLVNLQHNYEFSSTCLGTVPQAIFCFLISNGFEDAIRKSLSIGGDADTIACIVGSICEAFYGIDEWIINEVSPYIPNYIKDVSNNFYNNLGQSKKYILK
jgi:ADP-ribosylglycohydrolase